jgi:putative selenium metabolism hydrolase
MKEKEALIRFCRDIIGTPSYSGKEREAVRLVAEKMEELGFDEVKRDHYGSLIGKLRGRGEGASVLLDGHIDTVEVNDKESWRFDPFAAEIFEGKIYGRGASDMKGALAAMIFAAARFAGTRPKGDIYVTATVHEEMFEGVALQNILKEISVGLVIIGEASDLKLMTGQRGRAELKVESTGKSCHSANPEHGINAVYSLLDLIKKLRTLPLPEDPHLGKAIMELTDIISHPYPGASVVPNSCSATYDRRLVTGETEDSVCAPIRETFERLEATDPTIGASVEVSFGTEECYTGREISASRFFPAWYFDPAEPFVEKAKSALKAAGFDSDPGSYSFCTNGSASAGRLGIPTIGFGPSKEHLAHVRDEYIELAQLVRSVDGYEALIRSAWA